MERPVDRRIARTRSTLREALVRLIIERGWDEISVKDVCDAANVGRSTFYAHFGDKEGLLTSGFDDLAAHLRAPGDRPPGTQLHFVRPLVEHALDTHNRLLFRALIGRHSGQVVQRRFRQLVLTLVAEELGQGESTPLVRFIAGGVVEVLTVGIEARAAHVDVVDGDVQALVARLR